MLQRRQRPRGLHLRCALHPSSQGALACVWCKLLRRLCSCGGQGARCAATKCALHIGSVRSQQFVPCRACVSAMSLRPLSGMHLSALASLLSQSMRAALPRPYLVTTAAWSIGAYGEGCAWALGWPQVVLVVHAAKVTGSKVVDLCARRPADQPFSLLDLPPAGCGPTPSRKAPTQACRSTCCVRQGQRWIMC